MRRLQGLMGAAAIAALAVLAACGSSSNAPAGAQRSYVPPPVGGPADPQPVQFSITVPAASASPAAAHREYVSSGTQSVSVVLAAVNGLPVAQPSPAVVNVTPGSAGCSASVTGTTCTSTIPGAVGIDAFTVTLYSQPNAGGSVLSTGTILAPIQTSTANLAVGSSFSITLNPVVANLQLVVTPPAFNVGTAAKGSIGVQPVDASGAIIAGLSGTVDIALAGGSNAAGFGKKHVSTASIPLYQTAPFDYTGAANVASSLAITASLQGSSPQLTATAAIPFAFPPTPSPSPTPVGLSPAIYVLNKGQSGVTSPTVTVYPVTAQGNAAPVRTLQLTASRFPMSIGVDSSGQLHVGYGDGSIDTFAYNANGTDKPLSTLKTLSGLLDPQALAVGAHDELLTIGTTNVANMLDNTAMLVFGSGESGKEDPVNAWNFTQPSISTSGECTCSIAGIAMDASGNFYVDGTLRLSPLSGQPGIYIAPASAAGPGVTGTAIAGPNTTIPSTPFSGTVTGLALDAAGNIYESQFGSPQGSVLPAVVNVFASGASGNVAPVATIAGSALNIVNGQGVQNLPIAVAGAQLYVANGSTSAILIYPTSANGAGSPSQTISGSSTGLSDPIGIAIGLSGAAQ